MDTTYIDSTIRCPTCYVWNLLLENMIRKYSTEYDQDPRFKTIFYMGVHHQQIIWKGTVLSLNRPLTFQMIPVSVWDSLLHRFTAYHEQHPELHSKCAFLVDSFSTVPSMHLKSKDLRSRLFYLVRWCVAEQEWTSCVVPFSVLDELKEFVVDLTQEADYRSMPPIQVE